MIRFLADLLVGLELENKLDSLKPPVLPIADPAYPSGNLALSQYTCVDSVATARVLEEFLVMCQRCLSLLDQEL